MSGVAANDQPSNGGKMTSKSSVLLIIGEPATDLHKDLICQQIIAGLKSWKTEDCDLNEALQALVDEEPAAQEGDCVISHASDNLKTVVLYNPQYSTVYNTIKDLLVSGSVYNHIVYAGHMIAGQGSWLLQDDKFTFGNLVSLFKEADVESALKESKTRVSINCMPSGDWKQSNVTKNDLNKIDSVLSVNPEETVAEMMGIENFTKYASSFIQPINTTDRLKASDVVGNIRFSKPTLYIFPGGQGDSSLFGVSGFNLLVNGGYGRNACFWPFTRHLDRIDALLVTHLGSDNMLGLGTAFERKVVEKVHPEIGFVYMNVPKQVKHSPNGDSAPEEGGQHKPGSLFVNSIEEANRLIDNMNKLECPPQLCNFGSDSNPINLYHKVGHGSLDMYVLNPVKDSKEMVDFLQQWNKHVDKFTSSKANGIPLPDMLSICALLVWRPSSPNENITRILFPGNVPQKKVFEGLEKLKGLDFMKQPHCTHHTLTAKPPAKKAHTGNNNLKSARPSSIKAEVVGLKSKSKPAKIDKVEKPREKSVKQATTKANKPAKKSPHAPPAKSSLPTLPIVNGVVEKADQKVSPPTEVKTEEVAQPSEPDVDEIALPSETEIAVAPPAYPDYDIPKESPVLTPSDVLTSDLLEGSNEPVISQEASVIADEKSDEQVLEISSPTFPTDEYASQKPTIQSIESTDAEIIKFDNDIGMPAENIKEDEDNLLLLGDEQLSHMDANLLDNNQKDMDMLAAEEANMDTISPQDTLDHEHLEKEQKVEPVEAWTESTSDATESLKPSVSPEPLPDPDNYTGNAPSLTYVTTNGQDTEVMEKWAFETKETFISAQEKESIVEKEVENVPFDTDEVQLPERESTEEDEVEKMDTVKDNQMTQGLQELYGEHECQTLPVAETDLLLETTEQEDEDDLVKTPDTEKISDVDEMEMQTAEQVQEYPTQNDDTTQQSEKTMELTEGQLVASEDDVPEEMEKIDDKIQETMDQYDENEVETQPEEFGAPEMEEDTPKETEKIDNTIQETPDQYDETKVQAQPEESDAPSVNNDSGPKEMEETDDRIKETFESHDETHPEDLSDPQMEEPCEDQLEIQAKGTEHLALDNDHEVESNDKELAPSGINGIYDLEPSDEVYHHDSNVAPQLKDDVPTTNTHEYLDDGTTKLVPEGLPLPEEPEVVCDNAIISENEDTVIQNKPSSSSPVEDIMELKSFEIEESANEVTYSDIRQNVEVSPVEAELLDVQTKEEDSSAKAMDVVCDIAEEESSEIDAGYSEDNSSDTYAEEPAADVADDAPLVPDLIAHEPFSQHTQNETPIKSPDEAIYEAPDSPESPSDVLKDETSTAFNLLPCDPIPPAVADNEDDGASPTVPINGSIVDPELNGIDDIQQDSLKDTVDDLLLGNTSADLILSEGSSVNGKNTSSSRVLPEGWEPMGQPSPEEDLTDENLKGAVGGVNIDVVEQDYCLKMPDLESPVILNGNEELLVEIEQKETDCLTDPLAAWGKPMGLPSPTDPSTVKDSGKKKKTTKPPKPSSAKTKVGAATNDVKTSSSPARSKTTTKRPASELLSKSTKVDANKPKQDVTDGANTSKPSLASKKRPTSAPAKQESNKVEKSLAVKAIAVSSSRGSSVSKVSGPLPPACYVDLTYVPHHSDPNYCDIEFFKRVRARFYVFSSLDPSPKVLNALIDAKDMWEDKGMEVTIIPTYDTDTLRHWMALHRERLGQLKIDVAPSANRCTIQLQDHETSCNAYRLEF